VGFPRLGRACGAGVGGGHGGHSCTGPEAEQGARTRVRQEPVLATPPRRRGLLLFLCLALGVPSPGARRLRCGTSPRAPLLAHRARLIAVRQKLEKSRQTKEASAEAAAEGEGEEGTRGRWGSWRGSSRPCSARSRPRRHAGAHSGEPRGSPSPPALRWTQAQRRGPFPLQPCVEKHAPWE